MTCEACGFEHPGVEFGCPVHLIPEPEFIPELELIPDIELALPAQGPLRTFKIRGITFSRYSWIRWEANRDGLGVSNCLTPWGAWLALLRWERDHRRETRQGGR